MDFKSLTENEQEELEEMLTELEILIGADLGTYEQMKWKGWSNQSGHHGCVEITCQGGAAIINLGTK